MGVAVRVSTSTSRLSCLSASLAATPKRCSSSTMSRPRSVNFTSFWSRRCVPMTMSTVPSASPGHDRRLLRRGPEPGEHLHLHREVGEALAEGLVVLLGEHRGGHQHGDLLAVHDRLEGGAQRHLGLAVAHVAADQAVHGLGPLHVPLHVADGLQLVGRLVVGEGRLELLLPGRVDREGVALAGPAAPRTGARARRPSRGRWPAPAPWPSPSRCPPADPGPGRRRPTPRPRTAGPGGTWRRGRTACRSRRTGGAGSPPPARPPPVAAGPGTGRCRGPRAPRSRPP